MLSSRIEVNGPVDLLRSIYIYIKKILFRSNRSFPGRDTPRSLASGRSRQSNRCCAVAKSADDDYLVPFRTRGHVHLRGGQRQKKKNPKIVYFIFNIRRYSFLGGEG